ncbi:peptidylprolyl isomerase [Deferrisoma palaeochoriense]
MAQRIRLSLVLLAILAISGGAALGGQADASETGGKEEAPPRTEEQAPPIDPDTPILRINGRDIGEIWYERALAETAAELQGASEAHGVDNKMIREKAMERLVEQELLYDLAMREEIPGLDEEVERRFQSFVERVGGPEAFERQAALQRLNEERVRHIIRRELANSWYVENVIGRDVEVTEDEARSYYEANKKKYVHPEERKIYGILAAGSRGKEAALQRLEEVRERFEKGEGFAPLAREFSDEPSSRLQGGFMGYRTRDDLPPEVAEACFSVEPGELTPVVETRFGYHMFLVTEVVPPENRSFEEVREEAFANARRIKLRRAVERTLKQAGREAKVEVLLPH